jgi:clan AA aspartic protease (TIGR02281 family)
MKSLLFATGILLMSTAAASAQRPPLTPMQRECVRSRIFTQMGTAMSQSRSPYLADGLRAAAGAAAAVRDFCILAYPSAVPAPAPAPVVESKRIPVQVNADGHFYPKVTINGTPVILMADTGATLVSLSMENVRKVGINPQSLQFTDEAETANGVMPRASILLSEITVEGVVLRNVPASCCVTGVSLLGMSALKRFSFTMNNGWMYLTPRN